MSEADGGVQLIGCPACDDPVVAVGGSLLEYTYEMCSCDECESDHLVQTLRRHRCGEERPS